MGKKWLVLYVILAMLVALAWTFALIKDVLSGSWLVWLSGSQAFFMWLIVVDGLGVLFRLKRRSGFDDG